MLRLKLNHVSKGGPWWLIKAVFFNQAVIGSGNHFVLGLNVLTGLDDILPVTHMPYQNIH